MKTWTQISEDIEARRAEMVQRNADELAKMKEKQAQAKERLDQQAEREKEREELKKEIKQELKSEAYDPEVQGRSQIRKQGEGGRVGANRKKSEPEKRRMKAAGGGKMVPAKSYKDRKDIGTQRKRSDREQQPTQARGSAAKSQADAAKAERKKAALARIAAKKAGKAAPEKKKTPTASELLRKKQAKKVNPNYKPAKASGKTRAERDKIRGEGERYLRSVFKKQETDKYTKATGKAPDKKGKMKIAGYVNKRMST